MEGKQLSGMTTQRKGQNVLARRYPGRGGGVTERRLARGGRKTPEIVAGPVDDPRQHSHRCQRLRLLSYLCLHGHLSWGRGEDLRLAICNDDSL